MMFIFVLVCLIDHKADIDERIQDWNYRATKMAIISAVAREPKAADVVKSFREAAHPFAAKTPDDMNRRVEDKAVEKAIEQMKRHSKELATPN